MENFFTIDETEVIENFRKQNPTKEDYADIVGEDDPEFLRKYFLRLNPTMTKEDIEMHISLELMRAKERNKKKRYDILVPDGFEEIQLYNSELSFNENFEMGHDKKYILLEVNKNKDFSVKNPTSIATPQSRCIIDIDKVEKHNALEFIPIDYEPFFGVRLLSFKGYNSDFFSCDERVMFEALLIKYKAFDFNSFYWSKEKIYEEVGIKKDRATKILERFIELGIITKEVRRSFVEKRPLQINYYDLKANAIVELVPQIFKENDEKNHEGQIIAYLNPALFRQSSSKMQ